MLLRSSRSLLLALSSFTLLAACSSDDGTGLVAAPPSAGSGGSGGTGGSSQGEAGTGGGDTNGGAGGTTGKGGTAGKGGSAGKGGTAGKGGSAGAGGSAGKGGSAGTGGSAGKGGNAGAGGSAGKGGASAGAGGSDGIAGEGGSSAGSSGEGGAAAGNAGNAGNSGNAGSAGGFVEREGDLPPGIRGPGGVPDTCAETHGKVGCCEGNVLYAQQRGETCAQRCGYSLELGSYSCHVGADDPDEDPSGSFPRACGGPVPAGACGCVTNADCTDGKVCDTLQGFCMSGFLGCTTDGDCDSFAPHCASDTGSCETCFLDEHCAGKLQGSRCRGIRFCGCYVDADCPSVKPHCDSGHSCRQCAVDADCKDAQKPFCTGLGECRGCADDWDCKDPTKPVCSLGICEAGDLCKLGGDDASEPNDDGPAGARPIERNKPLSAVLCDDFGESDWYVFDQDFDSYSAVFRLSGAKVDKMSIELFDASFVSFGSEGRGNQRYVTASYLPKGKYYVQVSAYADGNAPYTIVVEPGPSSDCKVDEDCRSEWATQVLRGTCNKTLGACLFISGKGARAVGAFCDSDDDCATGVCGAAPFTRASAGRSICTNACVTQADCEAQPGTVCDYVDYIDRGCIAKCQSDSDCVPYSNSSLFVDEAWRAKCNLTKGYCEKP